MSRIFCAIDTPDLGRAVSLARQLSVTDIQLKLGLEFFIAQGFQGVEAVRAAARPDVKIFLDLKFHDIPNTVAGAVRSALRARPDFLTIHASGGKDMIKAAIDAAQEEAEKLKIPAPKILAVTVLTHLSSSGLEAVGQGEDVSGQVSRLAQMAVEAGADGIVSSPQELLSLKSSLRKQASSSSPLFIVPGIRPAGSAADDQKRTMTPDEAFANGADYLVIGRPITEAVDIVSAVGKLVKSD